MNKMNNLTGALLASGLLTASLAYAQASRTDFPVASGPAYKSQEKKPERPITLDQVYPKRGQICRSLRDELLRQEKQLTGCPFLAFKYVCGGFDVSSMFSNDGYVDSYYNAQIFSAIVMNGMYLMDNNFGTPAINFLMDDIFDTSRHFSNRVAVLPFANPAPGISASLIDRFAVRAAECRASTGAANDPASPRIAQGNVYRDSSAAAGSSGQRQR